MTVQIDRGSYVLQMAIFSGVSECPQFSCNKRKKLAHHGRVANNHFKKVRKFAMCSACS